MNIINYISLPKNGFCEKIQLSIVGPYPRAEYISEAYDGLRRHMPKDSVEIIVYADDSWDIDEIEKIKKISNTRVILVKAGKGEGLVHAKMYFFKCRNKEGESSYTLITGSANATKAAKSYNAEVMTVTELTQFDDCSQNKIKNYFECLSQEGGCKVDKVDAYFKDSKESRVILPALETAVESKISFYGWLKSGYLFYKYDKDPRFGFIEIPLENSLTDNTKVNKLIKEAGFVPNNEKKSILRYPYLECVKQTDNKKKENKKEVFPLADNALESDYGYWISGDCFKDKVKELFLNKRNLQNDILKDIKTKKNIETENIVKEIKKALNKLSKDAKIKKCIGNKVKNIESIVNDKIKRDFERSQDGKFMLRYTTCFAQHKMPTFDENDFKNFLVSAMESCLIKLNGERKSNLFIRKLWNVIPKEKQDNVFKSAIALSNWLDENWTKYYDQLRYYYKSEKEIEKKITITHVQQTCETDSGIACIAMLLDGNYDRVKRNAHKIFSRNWGKRKNRNYGMDNKQIKKLIKKFIRDFDANRRFRDLKTWDDIESCSLVSVCYDGENESCHWIIADREDDDLIIYDPKKSKRIVNPKTSDYEVHQYLPVSF